MTELEKSILKHAPGLPPALLEMHLRRMPESYVDRFSPTEIARHLRLLARLGEGRPVDVELRSLGGVHYEICVAGFDIKGILAAITSALAAEDYDVHDVQLASYLPQDAAGRPAEPARFVDLMRASGDLKGRTVAALADAFRERLGEAYRHLTAGNLREAQFAASDSHLSAGGHSQVPATPLMIKEGLELGDFRLQNEIAKGGMSEIYLATQISLQRPAAVKIMTVAAAEQELLERFRREASVLATFASHYIVQVFAAGTAPAAGGAILGWMALEYMPNGDLAGRIQPGVPPAARLATRWLFQALCGLDYAHRRGILHRDIKPHNLLLTAHHDLKVSDFGLMKQTRDADPKLTVAGTVMGTPQYIAPEQALAEPVDERSDIYSLGASFFHLLTGRPAFEGRSSTAILSKITQAEPPRMLDLAPSAARPLALLVDRMMARRPEDRYQDARVALDDLRSYVRRGLLDLDESESDHEPPHEPPLNETVSFGVTPNP